VTSIILVPLIALILVVCSAYLFFKWEWKALLVFAPILILTLIFSGDFTQAMTFFTPILLGGLGGFTFKTGRSLKFYLLVTSLTLAFMFSGNYYYMKNLNNVDILSVSKTEMSTLLDTYKVPEDKKKEMLVDFDKWIVIAKDIIPFSSFIYALLFSLLSYQLIKSFLLRFSDVIPGKGLEFFKLNDYLIFTVIIGWGSVLLIDKTQYEIAYLIGLNAALMASFLYLIQALGVIKFFILK